MAEAVAEKQVCDNCGVGVRDNTAFCYNCGNAIGAISSDGALHTSNGAPMKDPETQAALDDLAALFKIDEAEDDKLAKAAAERRRARVTGKKTGRYKWEPVDDAPGLLFYLVTAAVVLIVLIVVLLTAIWK